MPTDKLLLTATLMLGLLSLATRSVPFVASRFIVGKPVFSALERYFPGCLLIILVINSVKDEDWSAPLFGLPVLVGMGLAAALQLWRGQTLLSIAVASGVYLYWVN